MKIIGKSGDEIIAQLQEGHPEVRKVLAKSAKAIEFKKRQIAPYQGAVLYVVSKLFNCPGAKILEIGTFLGYSASMIAQAAPKASITTLNPKDSERVIAIDNLQTYENVWVCNSLSWDFLDKYIDSDLDMVWIDGDHKNIHRDMPWFNKLKAGGLAIFHDYSPEKSSRPCPTVFDELNQFSKFLGREPDILIVDDQKVGLAGFYRREGEQWK